MGEDQAAKGSDELLVWEAWAWAPPLLTLKSEKRSAGAACGMGASKKAQALLDIQELNPMLTRLGCKLGSNFLMMTQSFTFSFGVL